AATQLSSLSLPDALPISIADVSHYVPVGSALDNEARIRGNSVYFPGHVIPMLPEHLSNGLCSLKPDEDRLVMVCELDLDKNGERSEEHTSELQSRENLVC